MKLTILDGIRNYAVRGTIFLAAAVILGGCIQTKPEPRVSAEPTCFKEVTAKLNPGGGYYFFMDTRDFASQLHNMIDKVKNIMFANRNPADPARKNAEAWFNLAGKMLDESGIGEISGIGMSSIAIKKIFITIAFSCIITRRRIRG